MSGYLDWLPGVLRSAGVDVYVMPGAERRSTRAAGLSVLGVVWHHTATGPNWSDGHVAFLLRDGRRDLPGPLAQVGIERDGTWVIVALGRANHNGYGTWGNDAIGLEFYNSGLGEPWPAVQVESGVVGTAAICAHLGIRPAMQVRGHRETDPKRKIDPAGLDMAEVRRRIDARLHTPVTPPPPVRQEDDVMADPQGAARFLMRTYLGRGPKDQAELDFHAGEVKRLGVNGYIVWLEVSKEAQAWARKLGAEVRTPDA